MLNLLGYMTLFSAAALSYVPAECAGGETRRYINACGLNHKKKTAAELIYRCREMCYLR